MLRVLSAVIIIVIVFFIIILGLGYYENVDYKKTKTAFYDDKIELVWESLIDISSYEENKEDVLLVEITGRTFGQINGWKEVISSRESREYKVIEKDTPKLLVLEMKNTMTGLEGTWSYYLSENGKTQVIITEDSRIENIFWRGWAVFTGRHRNIDRDIKWIQNAMFQRLLNA